MKPKLDIFEALALIFFSVAITVGVFFAGYALAKSGDDIFRIEAQAKACPHCGQMTGGAKP